MPNAKAKARKKRQKDIAKLQTTLKSLLAAHNAPTSTKSETIAKLERLHVLLADLKTLQPPSDLIPRRNAHSFSRLLETYTKDPPFEVRFTDDSCLNATLVTTRATTADEAVVRIPVDAALMDTVPSSLTVLEKYLPLSQDSSLRLTLNLLYHTTQPSSVHATYIGALPGKFDNLLTYTPEFVATLPERLITTVAKVLSTHIRIFCMVSEVLDKLGHEFAGVFTWANYEWGCGVVMSRQNRLPRGLGLVPVWDMIEHDGKCRGSEVVEEDGGEFVVLRGGFADGEEVRMRYGGRGNRELLLYAGFVEVGNRDDRVEVVVAVEGALAKVKGNLLRKMGVKVVEDPVRVVLDVRHDGFEEVVKVMRVVVMGKEELVGVMRDGLPGEGGYDEAARRLLGDVVGKMVQGYEGMMKERKDDRVMALLKGEKSLLEGLMEDCRNGTDA